MGLFYHKSMYQQPLGEPSLDHVSNQKFPNDSQSVEGQGHPLGPRPMAAFLPAWWPSLLLTPGQICGIMDRTLQSQAQDPGLLEPQ